ncbi:MAG: hypothetical protein JNM59_05240 [Hyphomonadaceae bacterium]|nr:hypothetical protein [Hyphomonadaceae bacterium]
MTRAGYFARLAFSIVIDLFDFTLGRVPIFGTVNEGVGTIVLLAMWGPIGLLHLGELVDVTDQVDGFIPTATLIALFVGWREGHLTGKPRAPPAPPPTPIENASAER